MNAVIQALRNAGNLECADVSQILATLAAQMVKSGFSELDIEAIDEAADFVCGEMV